MVTPGEKPGRGSCINSDEYKWITQQKKVAGENSKNPGEVTWESKTYHTTLTDCADSLMRRLIRLSKGEGLADLLKAIEIADKSLSQALTHINEVIDNAHLRKH